jgi:hypothetical protein
MGGLVGSCPFPHVGRPIRPVGTVDPTGRLNTEERTIYVGMSVVRDRSRRGGISLCDCYSFNHSKAPVSGSLGF